MSDRHKMVQTPAETLMSTVVEGGHCIGCGSCTAVEGSSMEIAWTTDGHLQARSIASIQRSALAHVDRVCPFADAALNEDVLAVEFLNEAPHHHPAIGRHHACYVGSVVDAATRSNASSGGLGRFIAAELLAGGYVERVAHVVPRRREPGAGELFTYALTTDPEAVLAGAASAYYPVSLAATLKALRADNVPTAVVGLPCFIKALRLLAQNDDRIRRNVRFTIGLFCGGLRSARYAEMIGWQLGVHPQELTEINFREKYADRPANHKGHRVHSRDGASRLGSSREMFGTDYGIGFFKPKACDYCDDVTAELADVSVGDAWLPEHVGESRGTSVIAVRSQVIHDMLRHHVSMGRLRLQPVSADDVAASQASGLRHRREGTAYRCRKSAENGAWAPAKRRFDNGQPTKQRAAVYDLREGIREESQRAFALALAANDYVAFERRMAPLVRRYRRTLNPLRSRIVNRIRRIVNTYLRNRR